MFNILFDIKKKFKEFDLDIKFDRNTKTIGLLGASGHGKSVTLKCIAGLEEPDVGIIKINDRILYNSYKSVNIPSRMRKIGFLFQNYALFPNMTVEKNISFALNGLNKEDRIKITNEKIDLVRLNGMEKMRPYELSGGQQQRVALARALAISPDVLLLDEPFSALDEHLRSQMVKQMTEIISAFNGITIFVSHNMEEVYRLCEDIVILNKGRVEAIGKKEEIFLNPPTLEVAKLTGCKNFSKAKYISKNEVFSVDWGEKIIVDKILNSDIKYIGIRANYIRLANERDQYNIFDSWVSFVNEGPFRVMVYLSIMKKPVSSEDYQLKWDISKDMWNEIKKQSLPIKVCLDYKKIMFFYM